MANTKLKNAITIATVFLISILCISSLISTAMAKNDQTNWQNRMKQEQRERLTKLAERFTPKHLIWANLGANYADFISVRNNDSLHTFVVRVHNEGVPSIYVAMANITKDNGNRSVDWVTGVLRVKGVLEYQDLNDDGIYLKQDNDTRLQWIDFAKLDWTLTTTKETVNGIKGWKIEMKASDDSATYTIRTEIFDSGIHLQDSIPVAPTEAKIDFIFDNFAWSTSDSRLALITTFGGVSGSVDVQHYDDSTEVVVNRNAFAYFTWASTATVDGATVPVESCKSSDGRIRIVELNYPQGDSIIHDPILGVLSGNRNEIPTYQVSTSTIQPGFPGVYLLATMAVVIVTLSALIVATRKRMVEPKLNIVS